MPRAGGRKQQSLRPSVRQAVQMRLVAIARREPLPLLAADRSLRTNLGVQVRVHFGRKHHPPWLAFRGELRFYNDHPPLSRGYCYFHILFRGTLLLTRYAVARTCLKPIP